MNSSCPTGSCAPWPCPPDEALSALVDAALPSEAGAGLLAHCAGCPRCTRRLAELRALRDAFAALPAIRLEVDLAAQLVDRLQAGATPAARKRRQSPWWVRWADRLRP
ncbi:anti-sigma factor family protein, partial [Thauera aminoaromatica]|uniref:anti-sigma factor family protein n=1 Tax=Thauera aminoaromatica TaxID=164330 RepID=UPI0035B4D90E